MPYPITPPMRMTPKTPIVIGQKSDAAVVVTIPVPNVAVPPPATAAPVATVPVAATPVAAAPVTPATIALPSMRAAVIVVVADVATIDVPVIVTVSVTLPQPRMPLVTFQILQLFPLLEFLYNFLK